MNSYSSSRKYLLDVGVIRIILIFLLIIYHSLCPFTSEYWDNPQGIVIPVYYWIGRISYSFMLESFVFISGLILGYQVLTKGLSTLSFKKLIRNKAKRLIVPSIIFSIIYYILFLDLSSAPSSILISITEGAGHMWFLPMLFWCFGGIFIINLFDNNIKYIIPLLFILACVSVVKLPLRLNLSVYYFFFFYIGYSMGLNHINISKYATKKYILILVLLFILTFPIFSYLQYNISEVDFANKIYNLGPLSVRLMIVYSFQRLCQLLCSTLGVAMIYLFINYLIISKVFHTTDYIAKLSSYCFGVYIFQEFIIRIFYYKLSESLCIPFILLCDYLFIVIIIYTLFTKDKNW